jgi:SulP family sulfate permease
MDRPSPQRAKSPGCVRSAASATTYLRRDGVALVIARDIGQVRDVLRRARAEAPLVQVHRTIEDAVDAVLGGPVRPPD